MPPCVFSTFPHSRGTGGDRAHDDVDGTHQPKGLSSCQPVNAAAPFLGTKTPRARRRLLFFAAAFEHTVFITNFAHKSLQDGVLSSAIFSCFFFALPCSSLVSVRFSASLQFARGPTAVCVCVCLHFSCPVLWSSDSLSVSRARPSLPFALNAVLQLPFSPACTLFNLSPNGLHSTLTRGSSGLILFSSARCHPGWQCLETGVKPVPSSSWRVASCDLLVAYNV